MILEIVEVAALAPPAAPVKVIAPASALNTPALAPVDVNSTLLSAAL